MIDVDELEIIQLLQDEMAWVVQDVTALVSADMFQKHFKSYTVMQIFAGMQFETQIDTGRVERVEDGLPPFCQFVESSIN